MQCNAIYNELIKIIENSNWKIIAIDGRCTAGKTTLAEIIAKNLKSKIVHMDDYYLPFYMRTDKIMDAIGGNIDFDRIINEIIIPFRNNKEAWCYPYDCHSNSYKEKYVIKPYELLIIEGTYSCHPKLMIYYDYKIFLDINSSEQERRLIKRNPDKLEIFKKVWIPREEKYFKKYPMPNSGDIVINENSRI